MIDIRAASGPSFSYQAIVSSFWLAESTSTSPGKLSMKPAGRIRYTPSDTVVVQIYREDVVDPVRSRGDDAHRKRLGAVVLAPHDAPRAAVAGPEDRGAQKWIAPRRSPRNGRRRQQGEAIDIAVAVNVQGVDGGDQNSVRGDDVLRERHARAFNGRRLAVALVPPDAVVFGGGRDHVEVGLQDGEGLRAGPI